MRRVTAAFAILLAACSTSSEAPAPVSEVRELTGARTRAVWVQGDGSDPGATGDNLALMGYDSDDGRGERAIVGERSSYMKPLFTAAGDRIVFSRRPTRPEGPEVFVVNWDGTGLRSLGRGYALAVWQNRADGREWVYVGTGNTPDEPFDFAEVTRIALDPPSRDRASAGGGKQARELVWNKTRVSSDTFQVSADGRHAAGLFPWPNAAIAELPNGALRTLGDGCWTSLTTVRGPLAWYFDGAHRNLTLVDIRSEKRWRVNINGVSGFGNAEVYHPRWTNHPRFLTMSGPYNLGGTNQVRSGGAQTEVYAGRFSQDYSRVEAWARVTQNGGGDSFPDVWIDREASPHRAAPSGPLGPSTADVRERPGTAAPGPQVERIVLDARLVRAGNVPSPQSIAPYRNALVVNTYEVERVVSGSYGERTMLVAEWAIRDRRIVEEPRRTPGAVYRLAVERFDAHPELEGERLLSTADAPHLPLFYPVRQR